MQAKTYSFETPNFGDWGKGSHEISFDRDVYQRDYYDAPNSEIVIEQLRTATDGSVIFKFTVDAALARGSASFRDELLFSLNLLQENLGTCGVIPRDAAASELLATLNLQWEIFPPGSIEEVVARMTSGARILAADEMITVRQRVAMFQRLNAKQYVRGIGGLSHYVGALFDDDLVVFENVRKGNALYVLYGDWREVSQRPRSDLLKSGDAVFSRFVHRQGWAAEFEQHMRSELQQRGLGDSLFGRTKRTA